MGRLAGTVRCVVGAALALSLATGCVTLEPAPAGAPHRVLAPSPGDEIAALARLPVYDDPLLAEYLGGIVDRLASEGERDVGTPGIGIVVLQDPTIGAFAMPDARIYVHSGVLAAVEGEAQLAAVLAREITHIRRGHAATAADDAAAGIAAAIDGIARSIAAALVRDDDRRPISPVAAAILGDGLPHAYTAAIAGRGAAREREADAGAMERLLRAGYDPREAPRAFEHLRRAARDGGTAEQFFIGSEAASADRIATTTRWLAEDRGPVTVPVDGTPETPAFRAAMLPVVRENARLELRAGRFRAARAQLDRVLAADPADARAHLYDGELHRRRAQRARSVADRDELARAAMASFQHAATLDPLLPEVSRQIGLLYYQQGRHEQARAAFEEYLARHPDAPDAVRVAEYVAALTR